MLKKKMVTMLFAITLATIMMLPTSVFAMQGEKSLKSNHDKEVAYQELSSKYGISEEEIENLDVNLQIAMNKINYKNTKDDAVVSVPVSENLILDKRESVESQPVISYSYFRYDNMAEASTAYNRTVTSTLELKNILGITIVTLKSTGVFYTDGRISRPIDAYGDYSGVLWKLSSTSSTKGGQAYNAWVRNSFSGELNIGIDPVHITIQSFSKSGTVYCDANGSISSDWK